MLICDVMTKKVLALRPSDSLREAVAVFSENGISGAPVVDDKGRVVGILTEMDILRRLEIGSMEFGAPAPMMGRGVDCGEKGPRLRFKSLCESLDGASDLTVSKLMTSPVVTARPGDLVQEKAALMVHRRIRRLPVVDARGVLIGILSRKDLIRMLHAAGRAGEARTGSRGKKSKKATGRKGGN
jgi:CBS domain-containing protein